MNTNYGSGAVRSSAVRTIEVRGAYGAHDTYRFKNFAKVDCTDSFIWVPEIAPTVVVKAYADKCETRVNAAMFAKPVVKGSLSNFYIIMPSFICKAVAKVETSSGITVGHHSEPCEAVARGQATGYIIRVGHTSCKAEVAGVVNTTAILFEGKPKLQLDEQCCVFN